MKTAVYINNGRVQLVLSPEDEFETNIIQSFSMSKMEPDIFFGEFYDCQGGWARMQQGSDTRCLILTARRTIENE